MKMDSEALYFFLLQSGQPIVISLDEIHLFCDEDSVGAQQEEIAAFVRAMNLIRGGGLVQIFVRVAISYDHQKIQVSDAEIEKRALNILRGLLLPGEETSCKVTHDNNVHITKTNFIITLSLLRDGSRPKPPRSKKPRIKK